MSILPFWFRFFQCLKRYFDSKLTVNLYNAGKYFSKIVPVLIVIYFETDNIDNKVKKYYGNGFSYYLVSNVISTLWCAVWDYYMDWGLFRSFKKDRYMLREQLRFPKYFYYFAMVSNFILRFLWLVSINTYDFEKDDKYNIYKSFDIIAFC